jgi:hypothetical protein
MISLSICLCLILSSNLNELQDYKFSICKMQKVQIFYTKYSFLEMSNFLLSMMFYDYQLTVQMKTCETKDDSTRNSVAFPFYHI